MYRLFVTFNMTLCCFTTFFIFMITTGLPDPMVSRNVKRSVRASDTPSKGGKATMLWAPSGRMTCWHSGQMIGRASCAGVHESQLLIFTTMTYILCLLPTMTRIFQGPVNEALDAYGCTLPVRLWQLKGHGFARSPHNVSRLRWVPGIGKCTGQPSVLLYTSSDSGVTSMAAVPSLWNR